LWFAKPIPEKQDSMSDGFLKHFFANKSEFLLRYFKIFLYFDQQAA